MPLLPEKQSRHVRELWIDGKKKPVDTRDLSYEQLRAQISDYGLVSLRRVFEFAGPIAW